MGSKVIQVPMDDALREMLDRMARRRGVPRAEVVRLACFRYIRQEEQRSAESRYVEGYQHLPEEPAVGDAQVALVGAVLAEERW